MRNLILIFTFLLIAESAIGQQWHWMEQTHNNDGVTAGGIAHDVLGNVYVTGSLSSGVVITQADTLQAIDGNVYLAKYDSSGNEIWVRQFGNPVEINRVYDIHCDGHGNVIVTGTFQTSTFPVGAYTLVNNGNQGTSDFYIVKFDSNGNVLWANSEGSNAIDYSFSVCTDASGIYISGSFNNGFQYGTFPLANPSGLANTFIAKYSNGGQLLWAKCGGGVNTSLGKAICADSSGNIFLCGRTNGSLSFGLQYLPTSTGFYHSMYVFRFDSLGTCAWGRACAGGSAWNEWNDVVTDAWGNVYLSGSYTQSSIVFAGDTFVNPVGANNGILFLAKYDAWGNEIWARSTTSNSYGNSIAIDRDQNLYITGEFGYATSSSMVYDGTTLWVGPNDHNPDFLLKTDTSGALICATVVGSGAGPKLYGNQTGHGVYYTSTPDIALTVGAFSLSNPQNFFYNIWGKWSCASISTSLSAVDTALAPTAFPNPARDYFAFILPEDGLPWNYTITNSIGEHVTEQFVSGGEVIISTAGWANGIYLATVTNGSTVYTLKIVVSY